MSPYEINSYSSSEISQPSADSAFVPFAVQRSNDLQSSDRFGASASTQQLSEQPEADAPAVKPDGFLATPLIWMLPLWGAIVWLLLLGTASEAWKLLRYNSTHVKSGQRVRVPCKNCRFFSSNLYLKCAVRPSDALTERAIDCADFCQKLDAEETKPQAKRDVRH